MLSLITVTITVLNHARAARPAADPRALAPDAVSQSLKVRSAAATRQCLETLVGAADRANVDVLKTGDLAIHTPKGTRIEKPTERGTLIDPSGNCARVDVRGKLGDPDSYASIVRGGYARVRDRASLEICGLADQPRLRDLITRPPGAPPDAPSGTGR